VRIEQEDAGKRADAARSRAQSAVKLQRARLRAARAASSVDAADAALSAMALACAAHVGELVELRLLRDLGPTFARCVELLQSEAQG
jgi:hypothetical protein